MPPLVGKAKPPINVVGDVGGRIAIMVDDMIDDVKSFIDAAHILKERGAYKIYALATHGILSADAPRLIQESPIDEVRTTWYYTRLKAVLPTIHFFAKLWFSARANLSKFYFWISCLFCKKPCPTLVTLIVR